jgi:hypothetical protein
MVDARNSKEAKHIINQSLLVLEHAMELAGQKEDLDAMIAISDRLMMLYQYMSDRGAKKFKAGFTLSEKKDVAEDDESD